MQTAEKISGNAQRLGMTSTSILQNMMVYILIVGFLLLVVIIVSIFYVFPCLRLRIAAFLKEYYNKMKWNGIMRIITVSFLKLCIGLSI